MGGIALYAALSQADATSKQQHASVWPILTIDQNTRSTDSSFIFEFTVKNSGVGPAILHSAQLTDGKEKLKSWEALQTRIPASIPRARQSFGASLRSRALAPGDRVTPFGLIWNDIESAKIQSVTIEDAFADASLNICYCSVFEKCWTTSSTTMDAPKPVDFCPAVDEGIH
ncbi:hypothetical protein [Parasphingorhabdus sp.]